MNEGTVLGAVLAVSMLLMVGLVFFAIAETRCDPGYVFVNETEYKGCVPYDQTEES